MFSCLARLDQRPGRSLLSKAKIHNSLFASDSKSLSTETISVRLPSGKVGPKARPSGFAGIILPAKPNLLSKKSINNCLSTGFVSPVYLFGATKRQPVRQCLNNLLRAGLRTGKMLWILDEEVVKKVVSLCCVKRVVCLHGLT